MPWPKGKPRSQATKDRISRAGKGKFAGPLNPMWNGGETTDTSGYILCRAPHHPAAMMNGYVRKHRLVMEGVIGRPLQPAEHIHHKNDDRTDNRPENLEIMTPGDHIRHHHTGAKRSMAARKRMSQKMASVYRTVKGREIQRKRALAAAKRNKNHIAAPIG